MAEFEVWVYALIACGAFILILGIWCVAGWTFYRRKRRRQAEKESPYNTVIPRYMQTGEQQQNGDKPSQKGARPNVYQHHALPPAKDQLDRLKSQSKVDSQEYLAPSNYAKTLPSDKHDNMHMEHEAAVVLSSEQDSPRNEIISSHPMPPTDRKSDGKPPLPPPNVVGVGGSVKPHLPPRRYDLSAVTMAPAQLIPYSTWRTLHPDKSRAVHRQQIPLFYDESTMRTMANQRTQNTFRSSVSQNINIGFSSQRSTSSFFQAGALKPSKQAGSEQIHLF